MIESTLVKSTIVKAQKAEPPMKTAKKSTEDAKSNRFKDIKSKVFIASAARSASQKTGEQRVANARQAAAQKNFNSKQ